MKKTIILFLAAFALTSCFNSRYACTEPNYDRISSFESDMASLKQMKQAYKDSIRLIKVKALERAKVNDSDNWNYLNWVYYQQRKGK